MLKQLRIGNVVAILALVAFYLFGSAPALASSAEGRQIRYRTALGVDLDGDRLPETGNVRESDFLYQVSIHFTTGRPKVRLRAYIPEGVAGLSLEISDLNQDGRQEVVIR